ncbi:MAG TPA: class I SAM-dependent methyltransferase [Sulfurimonas autotrophica]|nr:class I SAM-dependent methyltransferase [Sulfurimonas autotrophica]
MNNVYSKIEAYYTNKIIVYGATPKGVDWNGEKSQVLRFEQLSKIIINDEFTLADIGCGYGKYCEYLESNFKNYDYTGYDLSGEMIKNAKQLYAKKANVEFVNIQDLTQIKEIDYSLASGIFSVKMQHNEAEWLSYIVETLEQINQKSKKGFSFNMLTKYSDKEYMKDNLYYADPLFFFDYCKRNFSRNISLNHDYDLYEFTILVRKD